MTDIIKNYSYHPIDEESTMSFQRIGARFFFRFCELLIFSSAIHKLYFAIIWKVSINICNSCNWKKYCISFNAQLNSFYFESASLKVDFRYKHYNRKLDSLYLRFYIHECFWDVPYFYNCVIKGCRS